MARSALLHEAGGQKSIALLAAPGWEPVPVVITSCGSLQEKKQPGRDHQRECLLWDPGVMCARYWRALGDTGGHWDPPPSAETRLVQLDSSTLLCVLLEGCVCSPYKRWSWALSKQPLKAVFVFWGGVNPKGELLGSCPGSLLPQRFCSWGTDYFFGSSGAHRAPFSLKLHFKPNKTLEYSARYRNSLLASPITLPLV